MATVECPYCGAEQEVCYDDGYGAGEDELYEYECTCGKTFIFTTSIIFMHTSRRADCLNGGEHEFKLTRTYPKEFARLRCTVCGEEKDIEPDEGGYDAN